MPIGSSRRRQRCAIWKTWAEAGVRSSSVVMRHPVAKDSPQVTFVDGNYIVQAFSSNRSNQPLAVGVGRGRFHRSAQNLQPKSLQVFINLRREDRVPIMDEKAMFMITGNSFAKLLQRPVRGGMLGHTAVNDTTRSDFDQQQYIEDAKAGGDGDHEITGDDRLGMIVDKCVPPRRPMRTIPTSSQW